MDFVGRTNAIGLPLSGDDERQYGFASWARWFATHMIKPWSLYLWLHNENLDPE